MLARVFDQVVDNGKMLRNFAQIIRSGAVGRKSFGNRPKKLMQTWAFDRHRKTTVERSRRQKKIRRRWRTWLKWCTPNRVKHGVPHGLHG